jgi:hypothetical protein
MSESENIVVTRCHHNFHEKCLVQAKERKSTCPLCRAGLTPVASTLTPVIYYEMTIPVYGQDSAVSSSRFGEFDDESVAPENPYHDEIASNSRRIR